jgi:hypothetical protein
MLKQILDGTGDLYVVIARLLSGHASIYAQVDGAAVPVSHLLMQQALCTQH